VPRIPQENDALNVPSDLEHPEWPENYPEQEKFKHSLLIQPVYLTIGILNNQNNCITSNYHRP